MPVGSVPIAIDMNPVTNKVYVNDANSNTVAVIDGAANSTITSSEPARSKPKNLPSMPPLISAQQAANMLSGLSLVFEPNLGQTDPQIRFLTRAPGMISFLTDRENVIVLSRSKKPPDWEEPNKPPEMERSVVRMKLEGARRPQSFEGLEKAESISNYLIGNDPAKWIRNVANYRSVRATGVYPGIDLVYYGDGRRLEYDFVVAPGSDPGRIHLAYEGAVSVTTDKAGNLLIATRLGTLVQRRPKVYQELGGERREVDAAYVMRGGRVEIALGDWDRRRELVIDPVLDYSTYLGGSGTDNGAQVVVDSTGAAYVTGSTTSTNFPITPGAHQTDFGAGRTHAFVTKLNPTGTALVYSTYLGGHHTLGANEDDIDNAIAVNGSGETYLTGTTTADDFPTTPGAFQETAPVKNTPGDISSFVTKLNADGSALIYSTYLGGNLSDAAGGIKIDAAGNAYIGGYTGSTNFPVTSGAFQMAYQGGLRDIFVTKLNPTGTALVYSTFVGGPNADYANNIAVDTAGGAYVTGYTNSPTCDFPHPNAYQSTCGGKAQNLIVAKLSPDGSTLEYGTFIGFATSTGRNVAVNANGEAYVTGFVQNDGTYPFPVTPDAHQTTFGGGTQDAYVAKLSSTGSSLIYLTYLGGHGTDTGHGITVDSIGGAYVMGLTTSTNFATTTCAYQSASGGGQDAFVTRLDPFGNLEYSTYLGGTNAETGFGIAVDGNGKVYATGNTSSPNFPTTSGAFETSNQGGQDSFVTKLTPISDFPLSAKAVNAVSGTPQSVSIGATFSTPLEAQVVDTFGNPVSGVTVTFTAPGSGASATFNPPTFTTDCTGAGHTTATANNTTGTYQVFADVAGTGVTPATFNLTNTAGAPHAMVIYGESTQSAQINTAFADPLTVLVTDSFGNPVSGVAVTFVALGTTANASLSSTAVPTSANGQAGVIATANGTLGSYMVSATSSVGSVSFNLTNVSGGTTTALTASPTTAMFGDPVALHATVTPAAATGLVFFMQGSTVLGSGTLSGGTATLTVSTLPVGTYTVVADYAGDANYGGSSSGPATITITKRTGASGGAALTVTANNATRPFGQENPAFSSTPAGMLVGGDTFASAIQGVAAFSTTATPASPAGTYPIMISGLTSVNYVLGLVNGTLTVTKLTGSVHLDASPNPVTQGDQVTLTATVPGGQTGTVTFYDGTTPLGTVTINGNIATLVISTLAPGTHSITAVYNGDANFTAATSSSVSLVINQIILITSTVTIESSLNPSVFGDAVTFTATVSAGATGTISFLDSTTTLGTGTITGTTATFTTSTLAVGTHSITAVYNGDANHSAASSDALSQVTESPDYAVSSPTPPQVIPPGASANFALHVPSVGFPFNSVVTLRASGLPAGASYTFNPPTVTPGANGADSTLTISVPRQSAMLHHSSRTLVLAVLLVPLAALRRKRGRTPLLMLWLMLTLASFGVMTGCGTGGYFSLQQRTYIITVTGTSGNLVRSTTVTLTVE